MHSRIIQHWDTWRCIVFHFDSVKVQTAWDENLQFGSGSWHKGTKPFFCAIFLLTTPHCRGYLTFIQCRDYIDCNPNPALVQPVCMSYTVSTTGFQVAGGHLGSGTFFPLLEHSSLPCGAIWIYLADTNTISPCRASWLRDIETVAYHLYSTRCLVPGAHKCWWAQVHPPT